MISPIATVFAFIPQQTGASKAPQCSDKLDSQVVSIFQAIGISYSILDRMIAHDASCADAAAEFFVTTLMKVCVRPSHLPSPAKPRHGVHLHLSGHQF